MDYKIVYAINMWQAHIYAITASVTYPCNTGINHHTHTHTHTPLHFIKVMINLPNPLFQNRPWCNDCCHIRDNFKIRLHCSTDTTTNLPPEPSGVSLSLWNISMTSASVIVLEFSGLLLSLLIPFTWSSSGPFFRLRHLCCYYHQYPLPQQFIYLNCYSHQH